MKAAATGPGMTRQVSNAKDKDWLTNFPMAPKLDTMTELDMNLLNFNYSPLSDSVSWLTASVEALQKGFQLTMEKQNALRVAAESALKQQLEVTNNDLIALRKFVESRAEPKVEVIKEERPKEPTDYSGLEDACLALGFVRKDDVLRFIAEAIEASKAELSLSFSRGIAELEERMLALQRTTEASLAEIQAEGARRSQKTMEQAAKQLSEGLATLRKEIAGSEQRQKEAVRAVKVEADDLGGRTHVCEERLDKHDAQFEALTGQAPPRVPTPMKPDPSIEEARRRTEAEVARLRALIQKLEEERDEHLKRLLALEIAEKERSERERNMKPSPRNDLVLEARTRAALEAIQRDVDTRMEQMREIHSKESNALTRTVKAVERQHDLVQSKVDDVWRRLPKVVALLEPLEEEANNYQDRLKRSQSASTVAVGATTAPGAIKEGLQCGPAGEFQCLAGYLREALHQTMNEYVGQLKQNIDSVSEECKNKVDIGELMAMQNKVDAWTISGTPGGVLRPLPKKMTVGGAPWNCSPSSTMTTFAGRPTTTSTTDSFSESLREWDNPPEEIAEVRPSRALFRDPEAAAVMASRAKSPTLHDKHGPGCHSHCQLPTNPRSVAMQRNLALLRLNKAAA